MIMLRAISLVFSATLLAGHGHALSWLTPKSSSKSISPQQDGPDDAEILNILHATERSDIYNRRPDCFRRVAMSIHTHCQELETNESGRIQAAISLTLCELATAKHSPPMECTPFIPEGAPVFEISETKQRQCVEALSRSAQYWSSYSGYLREVPQLCFAFLRWNEIDTAKDTYRNATVEHINFLKELRIRERARYQNDLAASEILEEIQRIFTTFDYISVDMQRIFQEAAESNALQTDKMSSELRNGLLTLQEKSEEIYKNYLIEMHSTTTTIIDHYAASTTVTISSIREELLAQINALFTHSYEQHSMVLQAANEVGRSLTSLGDSVSTVHQSLDQLAIRSHQIASELELRVQEALEIQSVQQDAMQTAKQLSGVLIELGQQTRKEISNINGTAAAVVDSLWNRSASRSNLVDFDLWPDWSKATLFWLLEIVLRVDSKYFDHLFQLPVFRFVGIIYCIFRSLLQIFFSSFLSTAVFLLSTKRWTSKPTNLIFEPAQDRDTKREEYLSSAAVALDATPSRDFKEHAFISAASSSSSPRIPLRRSRIPNRLLSPMTLDPFRL